MKTNKRFFSVTLLGCLIMAFSTSHLFAEEKGHGKGKGENGYRKKAFLEKFDKDGDGKLSEAEKEAAFKARRQRMIKEFDKDGDGKLSEAERSAARKAYQERHAKHKGEHDRKEKVEKETTDDELGGVVKPPEE